MINIILNNKKYKKPYRSLNIEIIRTNINEFEKYFSEDLKLKFKQHEDYYYILKFFLIKNISSINDFNKILIKENREKIWNKKYRKFYFSKEDTSYLRGSSFRGKKRPEHSLLMKEKMLGIDRGDEWRENKSNFLKSIYFKKKRLMNLKIDFDENNEKDILEKYKNLLISLDKNPLNRIKKIKKFLTNKKYLGFELFDNYKKDLENVIITLDNYNDYYTQMMSIISNKAMIDNDKMGKTKFFVSGLIKTLFCKNKTIIKYRSSWEYDFILLLEKEKIFYEYEPLYIKKNNGFYLPDFLFEYNNEIILLELKGFIRGRNGKIKEYEKIKYAIDFCKNNKMSYIYCQKNVKTISELNNILKYKTTDINKYKEWQ